MNAFNWFCIVLITVVITIGLKLAFNPTFTTTQAAIVVGFTFALVTLAWYRVKVTEND